MKSSISTKLFIVTAGFLMIFIGFTMYFQTMFFEKFYTDRKIKRLERNVIRFNALYSQGYISNRTLGRIIWQFQEDNNAKVVLLNSYGQIKYLPDVQAQNDFSKINTINKILEDWLWSPGTLNRILSARKTATTIFYNTDFNINNIVCVSPIVIDNNTTELILAVSSLQPIEEAASVIKEFYIYIFIAAFIIIIILSFIYSNMISKPLVVLNKAASKMAEMDFSSSCDVKGEDEIGNLARTLNFLARNLDTALRDLRATNIKLQEDIEKERHLDRMRKDFVAGVSHELKTPIALISGYAEGIKDNVVEEENRDYYLDVIIDETQKMGNLVSDMLDLSQLESGSFKLRPQSFSIRDMINLVIRKHMAFMSEKNIRVNLNFQNSTNHIVYADKLRIEQVLTNFLTNSIRHTPEGGVINFTVKDEEEEIVYTEIENSGEKIESKDLKNIWDKFYKVDKSRTRNSGGTGLGLSIVKNILLLHRSTFGVKNTEAGVAFHFTLQRSKPEEP
jgi:two-component system, OmpR family, sensor histidine kinase VanS